MRVFVAFCLLVACVAKNTNVTGIRPNVVVLFVDDLGYGDLETYGNTLVKTPYINELAKEGLKFTSWYSAAALCTPSRAALLTGRLPIRSGVTDDNMQVFATMMQSGGLPRPEVTIAEALKGAGYHTGMAGKWHLGTNLNNRLDSYHLPSNHGFDYAGLISPMGNNPACASPASDQDFCIFMRAVPDPLANNHKQEMVREQPWNITNLSARMANEFKMFLDQTPAGTPYFWYHSFIGVHTPLFASAAFHGKSANGLFGDMVEEMDWEVGQVMNLVNYHPHSNKDNTIVFFVSDNGPYREDYVHTPPAYGMTSPGPFKGGKGQTWEGGFRVPAIVWMPDRITGSTVTEKMVTTMDILPTVMNLAGVAAPEGVTLDGKDISNLLFGNYGGLQANPWQNSVFPYYCGTQLMAARWKKFKMHYTTQKFVNATGYPTPPTQCGGECCPYDPAQGVGVCGCVDIQAVLTADLSVLFFPANRTNHLPEPIIFDLSKDIHEDHPLTSSNFDDYNEVRATIQALVDEHLASLPNPAAPSQTLPPVNNANLLPCCPFVVINPQTGHPVIDPHTGQPVISCVTNPPGATPNSTNLYCQLE
jgi:hypothetical protein